MIFLLALPRRDGLGFDEECVVVIFFFLGGVFAHISETADIHLRLTEILRAADCISSTITLLTSLVFRLSYICKTQSQIRRGLREENSKPSKVKAATL